MSEIKRKKIVIVASDNIDKRELIRKLAEHSHILHTSNDESNTVKLELQHKNHNYHLKLVTSSGFEANSIVDLDLPNIHRSDAFIFIYNKHIPNSLTHLSQFIKQYRTKVSGNKFFPVVFVEDQKLLERFQMDANPADSKLLKVLTENHNLPFIKIEKLGKIEIQNILHQVIVGIEKEKNDEFPFNLMYSEKRRLNRLLKYARSLFYMNVLLFTIIICFSFYDILFMLTTRDFTNSKPKVDDLFLAARLVLNLANFISSTILMKYLIFNQERIDIINKLEKFTLAFNIIMIILLVCFHLRVKHLTLHNENYYSLTLMQVFTIIFYILSLLLLRPLVVYRAQKVKQQKQKKNYTSVSTTARTDFHNNSTIYMLRERGNNLILA